MASDVVFSRKSARRIGGVVRRVEKMPLGDHLIRSRHKNRAGGGLLFWAEIKSKVADDNYTGDVYKDRGATAIATGATIRVHDLAAGETIANGTFLPVAKEPWTEGDPPEVTTFWTVKQQIGLF